MAISDTQKIDDLYKKLVYGVTKTDTATNKSPSNESIPSPLLVRGDIIWNQANLIPETPPVATTSVVQVYTGTARVAPNSDPTVVPATRTWITGITNWIPPQFGSAYTVKVYADNLGAVNPQLTGTLLAPDGINNDAWIFDYQAGVLNFADTNIPAALTGKTVFIVGYTYVGSIGITNNASFGDLVVNGNELTTSVTDGNVVITGNGAGGVVLNDQTTINGATSVNGAITSTTSVTAPAINGNVTSTGTSTFATVDVNGGAIDGTVIGGTTPAAATFTTVTGGPATFESINNTPIGNAIPSTGAFTTLSASGQTTVTNTTQSTLATNGAVVVDGGVGIAKNLNVGGSVVISGDLTVDGVTTTVNSTTVDVADKNITIAKGSATAAAADGAGITVDGPAAAEITYSSTTDSWNLNKTVNAPVINSTDTTDSTSPSTGALTTDGGAGVAKDLWVGGTIHGAIQTGNLQATGGSVSLSSVSASVVTTANAQITGGEITGTPISGSTGNFTTLTTANAQITGGSLSNVSVTLNSLETANAHITGGTIDGVVMSNSAINTTSVSTANLTATGGTVNGVAITSSPISGSTGSFTVMTTSDAQISGGVLTGVDVTASKVTTANAQISGGAITGTPISGSTGSFTSLSSANVALTGGSVTGMTSVAGTSGDFTNLVSSNVSITGGTITGTPISGSTGSFTSLTADSFTADSINNTPIGNTIPSTGAFTTLSANSVTHITDTTQSTLVTNGAFIVDGGVGVAKNLNVGGDTIIGGNLTVNGSTTTVNSSDLSTTDRNITLAVGATNNATADGAGITVAGSGATFTYDGTSDSWNLNKTVNAPVINSTDTTDSTSPSTGALTTDGGAGVAKDLWVGGTIHGAIQTGNIQATGGSLTGLGTVSATNGSFTNLASGNVTITGGSITGIEVNSANVHITGGTIDGTVIGGTVPADGTFTTMSSTGESTLWSVVTANAQISGGAITGTPFSGSTVNAVSVTTADAQITGGSIANTPISGSTGSFTTMTTANAVVTGGTIDGTVIGGTVPAAGTFTNVTATTIGGTLTTNAQPNINSVGTLTSLEVTGNVAAGAVSSPLVTTANAQISGGAITGTPISGSTGSFTSLTADSFTADSINNTPIGNAIPSTGAFTTLDANGLTHITDTTQSTAINNGALVVDGGVGIAKNLNVGGNAIIEGNLTVQGTTTTVSSANLDVTDKNITVAKGAATAAAADGAGLTVDGPAAATILYTNTTDTWNFNKNVVADTFVGNVDASTVSATTITGTLSTAAQPNVTSVGSLTSLNVVGDTNTGSLTTANAQISGGTITATLNATSLTTANAQISGGAITGTPISGSTGSFVDLAVTGNIAITGTTVGTVDNINIGATTPGTGKFTSLTATSATFDSINNTPIGNAIPSTGAFTTVDANDTETASLTVSGVSTLATVNASGVFTANAASVFNGTVTANNATAVNGEFTANAVSTFNGNVVANSNVTVSPTVGIVTIAPTQTGSISNMTISTPSITTANAQISGGTITGTPISGSTGSFTSLTADSFIAASINNTPIGNAIPSTGAFTTLSATSGIVGTLETNVQPNINTVGTLTGLEVAGTANVAALTTSAATISGGTVNGTVIGGTVPAAGTFTNVTATNVAGTLTTAAQPNVTSVGTLTSLAVSGNVTAGSVSSPLVTTANAQITGGKITSTTIVGGTAELDSLVTANAQISGGAITNTPISGSTGTFTTVTANSGSVTNLSSSNVVVTGGTLNGVAITSSTGSFTTLSGVDTSATNFVTGNAQISGGAITGTPISGSTGSFTTITTSSSATVAGPLTVNANVESISTSTGSIIVTGGVGMSGNVHVGNGAFINSNKSQQNFVVKGALDDSLIFASSETNQVQIGGNVALSSGMVNGAKLAISSTDSVLLPVGTSGQRPSAPVPGMTRYNTTYNQLEFWNGSIWASTETVFTLITDQQFVGDGLTDTFLLTQSSTTNSTIVSINGVVQIPGLAYSVAGNSLQFSEAPLTTDVIDVRVLVTTQTIGGLASPSGFNQVVPDDADIGIWTGTTSSSKKWKFDAADGALLPIGQRSIGSFAAPVGNLYASNVHISGGTISGVTFSLDAIDDTVIGSNVSAPGTFTGLTANSMLVLQDGAPLAYNETEKTFGTSATAIDSFDVTLYRTAKYVISVTNGTAHQAAEVLVTHNGTTAYSTTYGVISSTGSQFVTFNATITSGFVELVATGSSAGNAAKVQKTYIAIPAQLPVTGNSGTGGIPEGTFATLVDGKVPVSQLPATVISETYVVASQAAMLALTAQVGDIAVRTDLSKSFILAGASAATLGDWQELLSPTGAVSSVNGQTGAVVITDITGNAATATTATTATSTTGNAGSATRLLNSRNIALTGDVTGTVAFDGTANVEIATTLKGDVVSAKTFTGAITCNYADGSYVAASVTGATTLTITGVPDSTRAYGLTFELTNAGSNITWPASVTWLGTAPTLRASGVSMVTLVTRNGGTTWYGSAA